MTTTKANVDEKVNQTGFEARKLKKKKKLEISRFWLNCCNDVLSLMKS